MEGERNMAEPAGNSESATESPAWAARKLLRAARAGTLATVAAGGQPFASLVTPATAPDLSVLLLLSDLSEHTRHLRAEPRCALMVAGTPETANPQTAPRVTVTGLAEPIEDPAPKARWVARHPYAAFYADFGDFHLFRLRPLGALFVGGFAQARRLRLTELTPDPAAVAVIAAVEDEIIAHCNTDHPDAMEVIARAAGGGPDGWRMVAVDVDGCDLAAGGQVLRVPWRAPVSNPDEIRGELVRLAREARQASGG
jgi:putative heme iron utilization protein